MGSADAVMVSVVFGMADNCELSITGSPWKVRNVRKSKYIAAKNPQVDS